MSFDDVSVDQGSRAVLRIACSLMSDGNAPLYRVVVLFLERVKGIQKFILDDNFTPEMQLASKLEDAAKSGVNVDASWLVDCFLELHCFYYRVGYSGRSWDFYESSFEEFRVSFHGLPAVDESDTAAIDPVKMREWVGDVL